MTRANKTRRHSTPSTNSPSSTTLTPPSTRHVRSPRPGQPSRASTPATASVSGPATSIAPPSRKSLRNPMSSTTRATRKSASASVTLPNPPSMTPSPSTSTQAQARLSFKPSQTTSPTLLPASTPDLKPVPLTTSSPQPSSSAPVPSSSPSLSRAPKLGVKSIRAISKRASGAPNPSSAMKSKITTAITSSRLPLPGETKTELPNVQSSQQKMPSKASASNAKSVHKPDGNVPTFHVQSANCDTSYCYRCMRCNQLDDRQSFAVCVACDSYCHPSCLHPPRQFVPLGIWACAQCHRIANSLNLPLRSLRQVRTSSQCIECARRTKPQPLVDLTVVTCSQCKLATHVSCLRRLYRTPKELIHSPDWKCRHCTPQKSAKPVAAPSMLKRSRDSNPSDSRVEPVPVVPVKPSNKPSPRKQKQSITPTTHKNAASGHCLSTTDVQAPPVHVIAQKRYRRASSTLSEHPNSTPITSSSPVPSIRPLPLQQDQPAVLPNSDLPFESRDQMGNGSGFDGVLWTRKPKQAQSSEPDILPNVPVKLSKTTQPSVQDGGVLISSNYDTNRSEGLRRGGEDKSDQVVEERISTSLEADNTNHSNFDDNATVSTTMAEVGLEQDILPIEESPPFDVQEDNGQDDAAGASGFNRELVNVSAPIVEGTIDKATAHEPGSSSGLLSTKENQKVLKTTADDPEEVEITPIDFTFKAFDSTEGRSQNTGNGKGERDYGNIMTDIGGVYVPQFDGLTEIGKAGSTPNLDVGLSSVKKGRSFSSEGPLTSVENNAVGRAVVERVLDDVLKGMHASSTGHRNVYEVSKSLDTVPNSNVSIVAKGSKILDEVVDLEGIAPSTFPLNNKSTPSRPSFGGNAQCDAEDAVRTPVKVTSDSNSHDICEVLEQDDDEVFTFDATPYAIVRASSQIAAVDTTENMQKMVATAIPRGIFSDTDGSKNMNIVDVECGEDNVHNGSEQASQGAPIDVSLAGQTYHSAQGIDSNRIDAKSGDAENTPSNLTVQISTVPGPANIGISRPSETNSASIFPLSNSINSETTGTGNARISQLGSIPRTEKAFYQKDASGVHAVTGVSSGISTGVNAQIPLENTEPDAENIVDAMLNDPDIGNHETAVLDASNSPQNTAATKLNDPVPASQSGAEVIEIVDNDEHMSERINDQGGEQICDEDDVEVDISFFA